MNRELAGGVAGRPQACIWTNAVSNLRVIDAATLGYETGGRTYVNRLRAPCHGLNPASAILLDVHAPRYCRGDRFRALETGSAVAGPVCVLGDWVPLTRR